MRTSHVLVTIFVAVLGCGAPPEERVRAATDASRPGLQDSAQAREAVEQYLAALARRDYEAAARLHVAQWRQLAPAMLEGEPDTLSFAAFLRRHCERGFYVCGLRLERVTTVARRAPDTLVVSFWSRDSTSARYRWGPCCGGDDGPDSVNVLRTVPRDSSYAVVGLPLYLP